MWHFLIWIYPPILNLCLIQSIISFCFIKIRCSCIRKQEDNYENHWPRIPIWRHLEKKKISLVSLGFHPLRHLLQHTANPPSLLFSTIMSISCQQDPRITLQPFNSHLVVFNVCLFLSVLYISSCQKLSLKGEQNKFWPLRKARPYSIFRMLKWWNSIFLLLGHSYGREWKVFEFT